MKKGYLVVIIVVFAVVASAIVIEAADNRPTGPVLEAQEVPGAPEGPGEVPRAAGTIAYDHGILNAWYPAGSGLFVGNLFNSGYSTGGLFTPILTPGTVTQVTFHAIALRSGVTAAQVLVFGTTSGGVAPAIGGGVMTGVVAGGATFTPNTFVLPAPAPYTGSYFMAGVFNTLAVTSPTTFSALTPGLGATTNTAVGPHGVVIAPGGTYLGAFSGFDALVRATGNIVVPVELMSFDVE